MEEQNTTLKDSLIPLDEVAPEQTKKFDPIEVEKAALTSEDKLDQGADNCAMIFKQLFPDFQNRVQKLSNKSLRRLIVAMVGMPLEEAKLNLKHKDEREAFAVAMNLLDSKNYMMLYSKYAHQRDLMNKTQETPQTPETISEEKTNESVR